MLPPSLSGEPDLEQEILEIQPVGEPFKKAVEAFREKSQQMSELAIRFHIGNRADERKWKVEFGKVYSEARPLFSKMLLEGAKEYAEDPENRKDYALWLSQTVSREIEGDRFEGLLPVFSVLEEHLGDLPELRAHYGMTAISMCDFDAAESTIEFLSQLDDYKERMTKLQESLPLLRQRWADEQAARAKDAAGEPLPTAIIHTTRGDIEIELLENQAPGAVANFIYLVDMGVYSNSQFNFGQKHFLVQGGGDDVMDPPYTIKGEMNRPDARKFFRGTLGMALSGSPDSAYSSFFFSLISNPDLDGQYTAFARVTKGIEIVSALTKIDPEDKKKDKDTVPDEILDIEITYRRDHPYEPVKADQ
ncbi:MAG: peptidylprolyl isomerase [Aureliella sp.]